MAALPIVPSIILRMVGTGIERSGDVNSICTSQNHSHAEEGPSTIESRHRMRVSATASALGAAE